MKTYNFLFILIIMSAISCQENLQFALGSQNSGDLGAELANRSITGNIKISCRGECDPPSEHPWYPDESNCAGMLWDPVLNTFECPCDDCTMIIENVSGLTNPTDKMQFLLGFFAEMLEEAYSNDDVLLYEVEFIKKSNVEVLKIIYLPESLNEKESIMYISKFDEFGVRINEVIEVDCDGTCTNASETCRERYIYSTDEIECTCAGPNCKMTVKRKEIPQN